MTVELVPIRPMTLLELELRASLQLGVMTSKRGISDFKLCFKRPLEAVWQAEITRSTFCLFRKEIFCSTYFFRVVGDLVP